tara:strand:+ start:962 stop:1861 length:900 start_codon:yes stop_codon:yes gene_type:complete
VKKFFSRGYYLYYLNKVLNLLGLSVWFISNANKYFVVKIKKIKSESSNNAIPPKWSELSESTKNKFSSNGTIEIIDSYTTKVSDGTNIYYDKKLIDRLIKLSRKNAELYYGVTDQLLYECLDTIDIKSKSVGIIGSTFPWYEAIILSRGGHPYTIEYNKLETNDKRLNVITVENYFKKPFKFDFVLSISSFEHDGLGKYGDKINPIGDIEAMNKVRKLMLNKNGKLILSVPIGIDKVAWNDHRIYGEKRFPKLIEGFQVIKSFGFNNDSFLRNNKTGRISNNLSGTEPIQPVFLLSEDL